MSDIAIIILAAGEGTRMKSAKPKVLHSIAGIPMVSHVLATAEELGAAHIVAVVRHERDAVAAVIAEHVPQAIIVDQDEAPGTGRAVELGLAGLPSDFTGSVVVLSADVPLLDAATVHALIQTHALAGNALTLLSAYFVDPTGAGRILRAPDGSFQAIVEQKDATDEQREINEVNAGVYVFDAASLREALVKIGTDNAQNEKYLTDAAAGIRAIGGRIEAVPVTDHWLVAGINDRAQLAAAAAESGLVPVSAAFVTAEELVADEGAAETTEEAAKEATATAAHHSAAHTVVGSLTVAGLAAIARRHDARPGHGAKDRADDEEAGDKD